VYECVQFGHVLELGVAVEQQGGVVGTRQAAGVQLLQVAREAGDALRVKKPLKVVVGWGGGCVCGGVTGGEG
jgi:hypothetical protein